MDTSAASIPIARQFYLLMKPGIIYGNLLATVGGYLLGANGALSLGSFFGVIAGTALIIGCGCVINNYTDRGIDAKMSRTKSRALVVGSIDAEVALLYGISIGLFGFMLLGLFTNLLTVAVGAVGLLFYVAMYAIAKRNSVHGTLIGSISGATPPVAGYVAATGMLDLAALLLFLALVFWQMPHFYAIAMYRRKDYAAAGLPVLPVVKGDVVAKRHILAYLMGFVVVALSFTIMNVTGIVYLLGMALVSAAWLRTAIGGFRTNDNVAWAKKVFGQSLIVLLTFSLLISAEWFLP